VIEQYEERLKEFMRDNRIEGEHLVFQQSCHSVTEAALAAGIDPDDVVKSICMLDSANRLIVGIVRGSDRVSSSRIAKALGIERPRTAEPEEILERTGYPCGGLPAFGYAGRFLIDPTVMGKSEVFAGGGSDSSLVRISPSELQKANQGGLLRIRK